MNAKPNSRPSEEIEYDASQWVMRRDRGLTAAEQDDLSLWLAANSRHGNALSQQTWVWDELDRLAGLGDVSGALPDPELLRRGCKSNASRRWWWLVPVALAAAAAGVVLLWRVRFPDAAPSSVAMAATTSVERRTLQDGSVAQLEAGAEIAVVFDSQQRRVRLLRGEASFAVARDPVRPFIVDATGIEVRAIGTMFSVALHAADIGVFVWEGRVAIAPAHGTSPTIFLSAGERAFVPRGDLSKALAAPTPPASMAAQPPNQSRVLEFSDATLVEVVAAFNRTNTTKLVIGDPELASLRLGGKFRADDVEGFLRLLKSSMDIIGVRRSKTEIMLLRRK